MLARIFVLSVATFWCTSVSLNAQQHESKECAACAASATGTCGTTGCNVYGTPMSKLGYGKHHRDIGSLWDGYCEESRGHGFGGFGHGCGVRSLGGCRTRHGGCRSGGCAFGVEVVQGGCATSGCASGGYASGGCAAAPAPTCGCGDALSGVEEVFSPYTPRTGRDCGCGMGHKCRTRARAAMMPVNSGGCMDSGYTGKHGCFGFKGRPYTDSCGRGGACKSGCTKCRRHVKIGTSVHWAKPVRETFRPTSIHPACGCDFFSLYQGKVTDRLALRTVTKPYIFDRSRLPGKLDISDDPYGRQGTPTEAKR